LLRLADQSAVRAAAHRNYAQTRARLQSGLGRRVDIIA
jgi:hypothetical protein